jgi:acylphosphatase
VKGRVQGVGFRWFAKAAASRRGIVGWVRNLPDGAVEVVARAAAAQLDELSHDLRSGPPFAAVQTVENTDITDEIAIPNTFEIR